MPFRQNVILLFHSVRKSPPNGMRVGLQMDGETYWIYFDLDVRMHELAERVVHPRAPQLLEHLLRRSRMGN